MAKNEKKTHKVFKNYEFDVKGLILVRKVDKVIFVEPLHIRSNLQRKILEISGFD
jgi:hypothetical protein